MAGLLAPSLSGCVYLAIGAAGAVGGYVVSPDTVEGTIARPSSEVWDSAREIAAIMGSVVQSVDTSGEIEAMISGARVLVKISSINAATTKVSVKARKAFIPKVDLAQDVYSKIINHLE